MANARSLFTLTAVVCLTPALAWWDNGHMLVAEIAKQTLNAADPTMIQRLDEVLHTWKDQFPQRTEFVPAATLPDFLKCEKRASYCQGIPNSVNIMDAWHFTDRPYNPQKLPLPIGANTSWYNQPSAIDALGQFVSTFRTAEGNWGWVFTLSFLIHILGDLHQPLHAVSGFFNSTALGDLTHGDRGGNSISISTEWAGITNLHAFWDAAGGLFQENAPYNAAQNMALTANATSLIKGYPPSVVGFNASEFSNCWNNASYSHTDPCAAVFSSWANESYTLAKDVAYQNVSQHMFIATNSSYTMNARETSRRQIALGGYRLAGIMKLIVINLPKQQHISNATTLANTNEIYILEASTGVLLFTTIVFMSLFVRGRKTRRAAVYEAV